MGGEYSLLTFEVSITENWGNLYNISENSGTQY